MSRMSEKVPMMSMKKKKPRRYAGSATDCMHSSRKK
jgi:hypothetical protein